MAKNSTKPRITPARERPSAPRPRRARTVNAAPVPAALVQRRPKESAYEAIRHCRSGRGPGGAAKEMGRAKRCGRNRPAASAERPAWND